MGGGVYKMGIVATVFMVLTTISVNKLMKQKRRLEMSIERLRVPMDKDGLPDFESLEVQLIHERKPETKDKAKEIPPPPPEPMKLSRTRVSEQEIFADENSGLHILDKGVGITFKMNSIAPGTLRGLRLNGDINQEGLDVPHFVALRSSLTAKNNMKNNETIIGFKRSKTLSQPGAHVKGTHALLQSMDWFNTKLPNQNGGQLLIQNEGIEAMPYFQTWIQPFLIATLPVAIGEKARWTHGVKNNALDARHGLLTQYTVMSVNDSGIVLKIESSEFRQNSSGTFSQRIEGYLQIDSKKRALVRAVLEISNTLEGESRPQHMDATLVVSQ